MGESVCGKSTLGQSIFYLGKIVEIGLTQEVFDHLAHSYNQALISAMLRVGEKPKDKIILEGEIPSPITPPSECRFRTRCRYAMAKCEAIEPQLADLGSGHHAACHLLDQDL